LKAKLAERERRRKAAKDSKSEKVLAKEEEIAKLEDEINEIEMDIDKTEQKGIKTKKHKEEQQAELKDTLLELKKDKDQKMNSLKNDYLERIAKAKTPLEKERLLDEMQRRTRQLEAELSK